MALTSTYTTILATQTDADSPLDTTLMDASRQNFSVLKEMIIGKETYSKSTAHDHDGVNSKTAVLADDSVAFAKLKDGCVQSVITAGEISSTSSNAWNSIVEFPVYIPPDALTLEVTCDVKSSYGVGALSRVVCATSTGANQATDSTYATVTMPTIDISAESSWTNIILQGYRPSSTGLHYYKKASYRLT